VIIKYRLIADVEVLLENIDSIFAKQVDNNMEVDAVTQHK
jgi:hypothetical protein